MRMLSKGFERIRRIVRMQVKQEVEDEIEFHLEMRVRDLVMGGMDPQAARAKAVRDFGDRHWITQECRTIARRRNQKMDRRQWLDELRQDIAFGLRQLARTPGFTAAALLTLALGIGANTAIFSVVDGVMLQAVPFRDVDRLVMVWETDRNSGTSREPASVPDYHDFQAQARSFEVLAAFQGREVNFIPDGGEPRRLAALAATHDLLPMLGIRPLLGRSFTPGEDRPGGAASILIGERLWEREFARDPDVLGELLRLDDDSYTVVGVVPAGAEFGMPQVLAAADYGRSFAERGERAGVEVWLPLRADPEEAPRQTHPILLVGRLQAGTDLAAAQRELDRIASELEQQYPENEGRGVHVERFEEVVLGPVRPALLVLLGAVGLVLLIACANVANLLLVRGTARSGEITVRAALGAGSSRLARQFLVEGMVLGVLAGALGIILALLGIEALLAFAPPEIPRLEAVGLDLRSLGVTLGISIAVGLVFGMVPAAQARRVDLSTALRSAGPGSSTRRAQQRTRSALVVAEVALAVMLLVGAGLLIVSFLKLVQVDPGFRSRGVLKAEFELPASRYPRDFAVWPRWTEILRFQQRALERVGALPGVEAVAISGAHPLNTGFTNSFVVVGREAEAREPGWPEINTRQVSPGYFDVMGVPLLQGRTISAFDDAGAPRVVVINRAAAERFFGARPPVGERLRLWGQEWSIVGVVGDEHFQGLAAEPAPAVYQSLLQSPMSGGTLLVLTEGDPASLAPAVRSAVREVDPALALFGVEPLEETLSRSVGQRRFVMLLLGLFGAIASLLAVIGVHGVLSYTVELRRREIGVRLALGAPRTDVVRMVLGQGAALAVVGIGLGLVGARSLTRLLSSLLYGVGATDASVFAGVAALLGAVALLASYLPARRATRVDPIATLRSD